MIIALSLLGLSFASTALVVLELRNAPEGYEDQSGFHLIRKAAAHRETGALERIKTSLVEKRSTKNGRGLPSPA